MTDSYPIHVLLEHPLKPNKYINFAVLTLLLFSCVILKKLTPVPQLKTAT